MKTKRNIFSKVVALVMCAVIFAGFAPTQLQANQLPIFITVYSQDNELTPIHGVEFALRHHDVVVEMRVTDSVGVLHFDYSFTRADLPNLSVQVVNSDGWHSEQSMISLTDFDTVGGGFFHYFWTFTPASTQTPEPPAHPPNSGMIQFTIGSTTYVNGGTSNTLEAAPFLSEDGRTMVPVRAIVEGLGSTDVGFNTATQEVTFSLGGQAFALTIGQQLAGNNGESMGAPVIVAGRTFVPVRFVSESVGAQVSWDGATQTVSISK